jgi:hypothetical protein
LALPAPAQKRAGEPFGRIAVTVFRDSGLAFPGAEVTLAPDPLPDQPHPRLKPLKGSSDSRGEYVFRVPVTAMRYVVRAHAKGFADEQKQVSIEGEETIDVTLQLARESKQ